MVCLFSFISLSRLHSLTEIGASGMVSDGKMYLIFCMDKVCIYYVFVVCVLFFGVVIYYK